MITALFWTFCKLQIALQNKKHARQILLEGTQPVSKDGQTIPFEKPTSGRMSITLFLLGFSNAKIKLQEFTITVLQAHDGTLQTRIRVCFVFQQEGQDINRVSK